MGRMNATLEIAQLDAETMGELIMFFQLATGFAGVWYGVDPFDQPGVELGKRLTFAAMGRPGFRREATPGSTVGGPADTSTQ
jgi:glucose-6-phosphate isomerase